MNNRRPILSICVPTYNRENNLRECLESLECQIKGKSEIELIISDNHSTDYTKKIVEEYSQKLDNLHYFFNEENLGFDGNTIKCIERANGNYMTLLSDEDRFIDGHIDRIISVINQRKYCLILLNYYGYVKNYNQQIEIYAPEKDVVFNRAFDILNYPSVGHFSGFIYESKLAKKIVKQILNKNPLITKNRSRGIYLEVPARICASSVLPSYFIGHRGLACKMTYDVHYNKLISNCLDYYKLFYNLFNEGIINNDDLNYRMNLVIHNLPRAIISSTYSLSNHRLKEITYEFNLYFNTKRNYNFICFPLLYAARFKFMQFIFLRLTKIYHIIKGR